MKQTGNSGKGTFILGIGAQKAGTTWLHRYLRQNEGCNPGLLKEYHIWNTLYMEGPHEIKINQPPINLRQRLAFHARSALGLPNGTLLRQKLRRVPGAYFEYFESLLKKPGITHTADITPAYAGLPKGGFANIRNGFERRGIPVRAVFLMRDPAERLWSAVRMYKRKQTAKHFDLSISDDEAVQQMAPTIYAHYRNNYHKTIKNLYAAFEPEDIHIAIYENMFEADEIARLSRFLGVTAKPEFANIHFNVSTKKSSLSPETVALVHREYADVYAYCARHFPQTRALWHYPESMN